jgi:hypothetical protein
MTIGRAEDSSISVNHNSVSRLHCEVHALGDGRYEIVDKGSSNGVRVNAVELKRSIIEAGDVIELDVESRRLDVDIAPDELLGRRPSAAVLAGYAAPTRGWERLYVDHVMQADKGADLDFLVGPGGHQVSRESH